MSTPLCDHAATADQSAANRCNNCPPRLCDQCGQWDHVDNMCACWRSVHDIPLADLKAMFTRDGLNVVVAVNEESA